jgi:hypothetical protein
MSEQTTEQNKVIVFKQKDQKQIHVGLFPDEFEKISKLAIQQNLTTSGVIRKAVDEVIKDQQIIIKYFNSPTDRRKHTLTHSVMTRIDPPIHEELKQKAKSVGAKLNQAVISGLLYLFETELKTKS